MKGWDATVFLLGQLKQWNNLLLQMRQIKQIATQVKVNRNTFYISFGNGYVIAGSDLQFHVKSNLVKYYFKLLKASVTTLLDWELKLNLQSFLYH